MHPRGAQICIVGETPGTEEVKHGAPFIGPSGQLLDKALAAARVTRAEVGVTNVLLCRPDGELQDEQRAWSRANQARLAEGKEPLLNPIEACRPRLLNELRHYAKLLPVGKAAVQGITGQASSIMGLRGAILELQVPSQPGEQAWGRQALATLHPTHVMKQKRWIRTFFDDIAKAMRLFAGRLNWVEPIGIYHPQPAELHALLLGDGLQVYRVPQADGRVLGIPVRGQVQPMGSELVHLRHPGWVAWDVETDGIESLTCGMRCIGFGGLDPGGNPAHDWAVVVGTRPIAWARLGSEPAEWEEHERARVQPEGWPWYSEDGLRQIKQILRDVFSTSHLTKIGHNAGYYDRIVVEQWLDPAREQAHGAASARAAAAHHALRIPSWPQVRIAPHLDTTLIHRLVESELPHSLDYVGQRFTDVHQWKAGHVAVETTSDRDLHVYNGPGDCAVSARIVPPLLARVRDRNLGHLLEHHHDIQAMCAGMHRNGMWVNQPWRERAEAWLNEVFRSSELECQRTADALGWKPKEKISSASSRARRAGAGRAISRGAEPPPEELAEDLVPPARPGHNPRSFPQVADLLFEVLGLTPVSYTDSGDPSTDDASLRALRRDKRLSPVSVAYLDALRQHRSAGRSRSSLRPLRPCTMEWRGASGELRRGGVLHDLRIHPGYNAHVPVTARISSSGPNFQNMEKIYRMLCQPMPEWAQIEAYGRSFGPRSYVGADVDQLELRLAAALAGCDKYLTAFQDGGDPHAMTALMLYESRFRSELEHFKKTGKKTKDFTEMRNFAKTFVYLVIYGGSAETAWNNLTATEDANGKLVYAGVKLGAVEALRERWLREAREFPIWWERTVSEYRQQGYLLDPIDGMRRDFLDGEDFNEIVNFKVQAGGAAIVRRMTRRLLGGAADDGPLGFSRSWSRWGPGTGLVTQTHDSNIFEVGVSDGPQVAAMVTEAMTYEHPGIPVRFTATAEVADNWMAA